MTDFDWFLPSQFDKNLKEASKLNTALVKFSKWNINWSLFERKLTKQLLDFTKAVFNLLASFHKKTKCDSSANRNTIILRYFLLLSKNK